MIFIFNTAGVKYLHTKRLYISFFVGELYIWRDKFSQTLAKLSDEKDSDFITECRLAKLSNEKDSDFITESPNLQLVDTRKLKIENCFELSTLSSISSIITGT